MNVAGLYMYIQYIHPLHVNAGGTGNSSYVHTYVVCTRCINHTEDNHEVVPVKGKNKGRKGVA